ncbi:MAG: hypothetical protein R3195_02755 [Gemmatimonadota bacterium]|nr:hypothetical protein [Gemmatimonadota bacterium]
MPALDRGSETTSDAPARELVDAGAALITALDAAGASPDVAFWLWFANAGEWRLLLAEGRLLQYGSRIALSRIRRMLTGDGEYEPLSPDLIGVSDGDAPAVKVLRSALWTGPGIHDLRIRDNVLNGVRVRRAYVYRIA